MEAREAKDQLHVWLDDDEELNLRDLVQELGVPLATLKNWAAEYANKSTLEQPEKEPDFLEPLEIDPVTQTVVTADKLKALTLERKITEIAEADEQEQETNMENVILAGPDMMGLQNEAQRIALRLIRTIDTELTVVRKNSTTITENTVKELEILTKSFVGIYSVLFKDKVSPVNPEATGNDSVSDFVKNLKN